MSQVLHSSSQGEHFPCLGLHFIHSGQPDGMEIDASAAAIGLNFHASENMKNTFITMTSHGPYDVSNHRQLYRLLNTLFRLTTESTSKLVLLVLCRRNPPVTREWFPHTQSQ